MTQEDFLNGQVLLIDKPLEWTSFQVVNKIRWHIKKKFGLKKIKVGHAGTLDPLATGLLILCIGKKTKNIYSYQGLQKEYTGSFTLGATTASYDLETEVDKTYATKHLSKELLEKTKLQFVGDIFQKPPIFSAIKKDGKRLYELARRGKETEIEARKVHVFEFEFTKIELPKVDFKVVCSKGTYIRSLAFDFGRALNSGAYLSSLRRTKIGNYSVDDSLSIEDFITKLDS